MIREFSVPGNYIHGSDSVNDLPKYSDGMTVIVTDKNVMNSVGHLPKIIKILTSADIKIGGIIDIAAEPTFEHLRNAAQQCTAFNPDTIISLGGGAVIDTAKALLYLSIDEKSSLDSFIKTGPRTDFTPGDSKTCRLIVIPTTSGTGSEVTCAAVFSDPVLGTKKLFLSPLFIPDTAILDPVLTLTLPPSITAQSGFDAFTHAIESYLCTIATPFTRAMSIQAISLIEENLKKAVSTPTISEREAMLYGSSIAGLAISNSCTGIAHSLDQIGSVFKVPHGMAMSPLLIPVLRVIADNKPEILTGISTAMKISGTSDEEKAEILITRITEVITGIGLPLSFSDLGIDKTNYRKAAKTIVPGAMEAFATKVFPIPATEKMLHSILIDAY